MSVMDSVNKYRHGVLLGNYVQDKFGTDLTAKGPEQDVLKSTSMKSVHDKQHSLYKHNAVIASKMGQTKNFYDCSKGYSQQNYKKPQAETSNDIFYRQQVDNRVPILVNNPKKQDVKKVQGKLYDETRYYLSNKFSSPYQNGNQNNNDSNGGTDKQSIRETGNINDTQGQEIPDILTGNIWKHAHKKPDQQVYGPTRDRNQATTKVHATCTSNSINPYGSSSIIKPQVEQYDHEMYKRFVLPSYKGEQRDILIGHGLEINQFQRRQMTTSYDLSYNQQIPPQTQVNSFYNANPDETAKKYHRETLYERTYQDKIPQYGTKTLLGQQKWGRPYDPYTKTYDNNHLKNEYLRK